MIQLVWFKRDLRTADHAPLAAAAAAGPVLPLYVVEPGYWQLPDTSRRQWLVTAEALQELAARLAALGAPLIVRTGAVTDVLAKIHAHAGIAHLWAHEETGNDWTFRRDIAVRAFCRRAGIGVTEFSQTGVIRGHSGARNRWAGHYARFMAAPLAAEPTALTPVPDARPLPLPAASDLGLPDDGCAAPQSGTRAAALTMLQSFLEGRGAGYRRGMSSPLGGAASCSRLSVPLATGAVSVREVLQLVYAARRALADTPPALRPVPVTALDSLVSRLHWRGHFMQKLESEPALEYRALHKMHETARHPTPADDAALAAWAAGRTGIPFLDACMRSLVATGWLNFRMRAMVQAFAAYHLQLDWQASGARLARLFTDYEPGIHWPQVQMQSGATGINTPRIYNPVKQGQKHDPDGIFTRLWVPELAAVPLAQLHSPFAGLNTSRLDYPPPLVDIADAARAAKARLTALRAQPGYREAALAVFAKHGSRARSFENDHPRPQRLVHSAERASGRSRATPIQAPQAEFTFEPPLTG
jgi:deoxyribodipyrimidine photo-lyase